MMNVNLRESADEDVDAGTGRAELVVGIKTTMNMDNADSAFERES